MRCSSRHASIKVFQQQPDDISPALDHDVQALLWPGPCDAWVGHPDLSRAGISQSNSNLIIDCSVLAHADWTQLGAVHDVQVHQPHKWNGPGPTVSAARIVAVPDLGDAQHLECLHATCDFVGALGWMNSGTRAVGTAGVELGLQSKVIDLVNMCQLGLE